LTINVKPLDSTVLSSLMTDNSLHNYNKKIGQLHLMQVSVSLGLSRSELLVIYLESLPAVHRPCSMVKNKKSKFTIFREEATSALAGFHAGPLC